MSDRWCWETEESEWGVDFDRASGKLGWWGADKPRPGVSPFALGGGGMDQSVDEFLAAGRGPYDCPPGILAEIAAEVGSYVRARG